MPTYEYECLSCSQRFEKRQSFSEEPVAECPDCGCQVRRVLYPAGIIFKGSGWYITDSKRPQPVGGSKGGSDKGEAVEASASAGESADAKGKSEAGEKKESTVKKTEGEKALTPA
ncbi:MAG: zinc ribbon domain-containing protein [Chloroflexi bacterium]|nr:zinc ribbon domain-containing protein [Chloroflexota bacterium]